jgi:hypothetical protein
MAADEGQVGVLPAWQQGGACPCQSTPCRWGACDLATGDGAAPNDACRLTDIPQLSSISDADRAWNQSADFQMYEHDRWASLHAPRDHTRTSRPAAL